MSDIENILVHAWNKDAVNLTPALDAVMTSKAADVIDSMYASVAASMFGQEVAVENEEESLDNISTEDNSEISDQNIEEPSNEIS